MFLYILINAKKKSKVNSRWVNYGALKATQEREKDGIKKRTFCVLSLNFSFLVCLFPHERGPEFSLFPPGFP